MTWSGAERFQPFPSSEKMGMTTIFGIKNCDTMKKAFVWLDQHGVSYRFHDYKKEGIDRDTLSRWVDTLGWERVLNRAGTTFRKLSEEDKAGLDAAKAITLMQREPSMIKRPILEPDEGPLTAGFSPDVYENLFGTK
jgi:Spx/MgsR family transcriptional regulator